MNNLIPLMRREWLQHRFAWAMLVLVPFVLLALHELGQWTWPDGPRDAFDSLRDLGLNALGAWLAARPFNQLSF